MIDKKILQEKNLQNEMLSDEQLEKVSGGQGGHMFDKSDPFKSLLTGNNDDPGNERPQANGGH